MQFTSVSLPLLGNLVFSKKCSAILLHTWKLLNHKAVAIFKYVCVCSIGVDVMNKVGNFN